MQDFKSLSQSLTNLSGAEFETRAIELFRHQAKENSIYKKYLDARKVKVEEITELKDIPFLPIQLFKNHKVVTGNEEDYQEFFSSSGTTGMITSRHYFKSDNFYLQHSLDLFELEYGPISDFHVLALLPAYLEREGSSLVSMANHWIEKSKSEHSGFYLRNHEELVDKINLLGQGGERVLLLGVTFALLDLAEEGRSIQNSERLIVMETGGMKGRRKEMIREEVHDVLKPYFNVPNIHSEYGMTELFSQAYSKGRGKYKIPPSMHVILRDINDPFSLSNQGRGGINVIDLANFDSCAFIETQDQGSLDSEGFLEVLGRIDNSEIRGCNLLV